ncbi:hypothetical protein VPH35_058435 [Triticum aestivum]
MPRKRKGSDDGHEGVPSKKPKHPPPRNRASPNSLLDVCKDLSDGRKNAIDEMDLKSLREIKCDHLFSFLSEWLVGLYEPDSREAVVPGRGRIPVNEELVHRVMGVPRGGDDVPYGLPTETDIELGIEMFGELGHTPKMTDVLDLITSSVNYDEKFKRMWLMLAGNTIIAPTTSNKISPRWYGVLDLNWSKFVVDEHHKALLKGRPTKGCLLFYNLLYIDAIDLTGLGISLPDGAFAINVWTKEKISELLSMDVEADGISYGKLPLQPQFGVDFCLFGGLQGLGKFMRVHVPPNCSEEKLAKASELVGQFSSGLVGLLGDLVQGFISLDDEGCSHVSRRLDTDLRAISSATRNMAMPSPACRTRQSKSPGKNNMDESDIDRDTDENDGDESDDDDDDFTVLYHGSSSRGGVENVASGSGAADLPSPPRPAQPPVPAQLSERDIHLSVMKVVVQELGIRVADKGTGEVIRPSTGTKQVPRRAPCKQVGTLEASSTSVEAAAALEVASDAAESVEQLDTVATVTVVVEELATAAVNDEIHANETPVVDTAQHVTEPVTEAAQVSVPPEAGVAVVVIGVDAGKIALGMDCSDGNYIIFLTVVFGCTMLNLTMMKYLCGGKNLNITTHQPKEKLLSKECMQPSATPRSLIRKVRVTRPSQYLLPPPYSDLIPSEDDEVVYAEVIKHTTDSNSKIKDVKVINIDGRWVTLGELANLLLSCMFVFFNIWKCQTRLSSLGCCPFICLLETSNLLFPALQKLGPGPDDGHWYVLSLNLKAKRFEVLDSLREEDSPSLIEHATRYMNAIKKAWLISYKYSHKQIQDYELVYIDVFKQENGTDCGYFAFMSLELWNGKIIPTFTHEQ